MKYASEFYSVSGERMVKVKGRSYASGRSVSCGKGETPQNAIEDMFGSNAFMDMFTNAKHFAPKLEDVERYGDPIGTYQAGIGSWRWVYNRQ